MIVYGDHRELLTPARAVLRLHDALERVACALTGAPDLRPDDALTELLIEAGILEQAVADMQPANGLPAPGASDLAMRLTDLAADGVARSSSRADTPPEWWVAWRTAVGALVHTLARAEFPGPLTAVLPEGYLFYSLYPLAYLLRMRRHLLAARFSPHGLCVIVGIRSIGTSLSAVAAAACRAEGLPVRRLTVRPHGLPFGREVSFAARTLAELRSLAAGGARFVLVDEGPGLSGSSLASLARCLHECAAVPHAAMAFLCANPRPGPQAPPWVLDYWRAVPCWSVSPRTASVAVAHALTALDEQGSVEADLSAGAWRAHTTLPPHIATSHPRFERSKYLCRDAQGGLLRAKFIGLGRLGRLKAQRADHLATQGYVPPVRGYTQGFLFSEHVEARPLQTVRPASAEYLDRVAAYLAHLSRLPAPHDLHLEPAAAIVERLHDLVASNTRAWFATTLDRELAALRLHAAPVAASLRDGGDGKPQPHEWLATTPALKCDAADHHLDHGAVWPLDPAYDIAGTVLEWSLDSARADHLVARYVQLGGDTHVVRRLPFFTAVYAAALLGQHDMAYHLEGGTGHAAAAHDAARRRYAEALRGTLLAAAPAPMVQTW